MIFQRLDSRNLRKTEEMNMPRKAKKKFAYQSFYKVCKYRLIESDGDKCKPFQELINKGHEVEAACQLDLCPLLWENRAAALGEIGLREEICVVADDDTQLES
jgi:hypothetical protein